VTRLRVLGWDHPRCVGPLRACAEAWEARTPGTTVECEFRSLTAFGDQPLEEAAPEYDLVVVDHPFCGVAEASGCLIPLDELLEAEHLDILAADAIGPTHASYSFGGHQWGLATDAACQVGAIAVGLDAPETWDDALALAADLDGRVATPLSPPHAISSFLSLVASVVEPMATDELVEQDAGEWALDVLARLTALGPTAALAWEPPEVLDRLTRDDGGVLYAPLTYGYVTYSTERVARPCRFVDVPGGRGAVLGGAGLAVSAAAEDPGAAAAFAAWASGAEAQQTIVAPAGGQPGSRSAWEDKALDEASGGFFSATQRSLEHAWTRPRDAWWPAFQLDAGTLLLMALAEREPGHATLNRLNDLYRERSAS
jgi:multiple sugar transport system substrate-binding protein